jgi:hypothetical protein
MPHVYHSLALALQLNKSHLITISQIFQFGLNQIKHAASLPPDKASRLSSFYQANSDQSIHHARAWHHINCTLHAQSCLIWAALCNPMIPTSCPISHPIDCTPSGTAFSDSSLVAAGGYSLYLHFWWYLEWPQFITARTLTHIKIMQMVNLLT